ncbi:MAG TPA: HNH endonuclease signature motif containing protein [Actinomycetota bacterium]|nr:HNH endonuclease signature motif containing protein [Actinomycetota bacterium]
MTARALAKDSIVAALATDGTDIRAVSHLGRKVTARQRTALETRDPMCVVPGCDASDHLEIDHITGVKDQGPTKLNNLARLCPWHHYMKTYKGWVLSGAPGGWHFAGPGPPDTS